MELIINNFNLIQDSKYFSLIFKIYDQIYTIMHGIFFMSASFASFISAVLCLYLCFMAGLLLLSFFKGVFFIITSIFKPVDFYTEDELIYISQLSTIMDPENVELLRQRYLAALDHRRFSKRKKSKFNKLLINDKEYQSPYYYDIHECIAISNDILKNSAGTINHPKEKAIFMKF